MLKTKLLQLLQYLRDPHIEKTKVRIIVEILFSILLAFLALYLQYQIRRYAWATLFVLLYPTIFLSSLFFGLFAGVASWLTCLVGANYYFLFPVGSFVIDSVSEWISLGLFSSLSLLIILSLHHSQRLKQRLRSALKEKDWIEKQQKKASSLLKKLSDLDLMGIIHFSRSGEILEANDAFLNLLGYSHDDLLQGEINWEKITPSEWALSDEAALADLDEKAFFDAFEKEYFKKNGERIRVLVGGALFEGDVEGGAAFVLDLSGQKESEHLRRELELLVENTDQFVALTDAEGRLTYVNDKALQILKAPREDDVYNIRLTEIISSYDLGEESGSELTENTRSIKEGFEQEVILSSPFSGGMVPLRLQSFPIIDEGSKKARRYAFLGRDLRNEIENQERLQTALDVAGMAIWQYDLETEEYSRSGEHDRLYGFETNLPEWTNDIFFSLLHPLDEQRVAVFFESLKHGSGAGSDFSINYRVRLPDESLRWISSRGKIMRREGKPVKLVGGILDITKLKTIESDLKRALKVRDQFLSVASHELKTPVTSLQLQLELLSHHLQEIEKGAKPVLAEIRDVIHESKEQFSRLTGLINDLLDVTRIANGKLKLNMEKHSLSEIWASVIRSVYYAPGVELSSSEENIVASFDEERLRQVMLNLLTNAIKFGQDKTIFVSIQADPEKNLIQFRVRDQGIGISSHELDQIFDRFGQAHSGKERKGLGLGLFISREIIKAHHGKISVKSQLNEGTEFKVSIPIQSTYDHPLHL